MLKLDNIPILFGSVLHPRGLQGQSSHLCGSAGGHDTPKAMGCLALWLCERDSSPSLWLNPIQSVKTKMVPWMNSELPLVLLPLSWRRGQVHALIMLWPNPIGSHKSDRLPLLRPISIPFSSKWVRSIYISLAVPLVFSLECAYLLFIFAKWSSL